MKRKRLPRFRIVNETRLQDGHVKAFVEGAGKIVYGSDWAERKRKGFRLVLKYRRANDDCYVSGYAYYHTSFVTVSVPKTLNIIQNPAMKRYFAFVIGHEMGHAKGITHKEMKGLARYDERNPNWAIIYGWAKDLPLEEKRAAAKRGKPKATAVEQAEKELAHAKTKRSEWTKKRTSAERLRKKWMVEERNAKLRLKRARSKS